MSRSIPVACLLTLLVAALLQPAAADPATHAGGDAARGQALYQARCTACHSVDYPGVGPAHRGVFGRRAGTSKGFDRYSTALKASGLVWTELNLDRWLTDPEKLVPGQAMGISVPDAGERADLIAYLRTLKAVKE
ncbi:MAG: c-type cytochrome [Pelomonas sp.]|nr:c-type cytochrome [Roseateles sp.]